ncbi:hypothetical protein DPMN_149471 [Dreissena polymorpha]|uniref:Uncharacterized protein n=1 Tax=Dreissena polymorpha TaxID=45954 RepID=A0A9D4FBE7_DREPO|nr:hypothetical protein DPMN_149471 [Dreissena polymorpha]
MFQPHLHTIVNRSMELAMIYHITVYVPAPPAHSELLHGAGYDISYNCMFQPHLHTTVNRSMELAMIYHMTVYVPAPPAHSEPLHGAGNDVSYNCVCSSPTCTSQ